MKIMICLLKTLVLLLIDDKRVNIFSYCRDGEKRGSTSVRKTDKKRNPKTSRKLNGFCLARITATECLSTGAVTVFYIATHTNHDLTLDECKHLPLPQSMRTVQEMLAKDISMAKVLDSKLHMNLLLLTV